MGKSFERAAEPVLKVMQTAMRRFRQDLVEVDLRVNVTMVRAARDRLGMPTGPALTRLGVPVMASIKLLGPSERCRSPFDCSIMVDADRWDSLDDDERIAMFHHELCHVVIVRDRDGQVVVADDGRPKLTSRPDDWSLTGFAEVVKAHGEAALEFQAMVDVVDHFGQLLFPWMAEQAKRTAAVAEELSTPG